MAYLSLSQRLIDIRELIAVSVEPTNILREVDMLISFEKHLRLHVKDETISSLKKELKILKEKVKKLSKEKN
jgi:hypothetical protein